MASSMAHERVNDPTRKACPEISDGGKEKAAGKQNAAAPA